MDARRSTEFDKTSRRLVRRWVAGRRTLDGQVEGLAVVVTVLGGLLEAVIGGVATRATLSRALVVAGRRHPELKALSLPRAGLEVFQLKDELKGHAPEATCEMLSAVAEEWFTVLDWLLGKALLPILREAEADLAARRPKGGTSREGP